MKATTQTTPAQYRREGSSLFQYSSKHGAYVHCYQNPRLSSLAALIRAYENQAMINADEMAD